MAPASVYPSLRCADAAAAMDWLERTLGFERREDHRDEEGNVVHAELALGDAVVMLSTAGVGREPFRSHPTGCSLVYIASDEVESLYERAKEAGGDIALELTETDYGSRDFTLRDPEGNLWSFGTYRPAS
ncbi:MAG TPA: VOC family protein [Solirubrobacterales bacterium]